MLKFVAFVMRGKSFRFVLGRGRRQVLFRISGEYRPAALVEAHHRRELLRERGGSRRHDAKVILVVAFDHDI